jgi:hypothetical protein
MSTTSIQVNENDTRIVSATDLAIESHSGFKHSSRPERRSTNAARQVEPDRFARSPQRSDPMPSELQTISYLGQIEVVVTLVFLTWAFARLIRMLLY